MADIDIPFVAGIDAPAIATANNESKIPITFRDVLSALNPLQHLPVVGMIYRAITGDTIPAPLRVLGSIVSGLLGGGPFGVVGTILTCLGEEIFGDDDTSAAAPASSSGAASAPVASSDPGPAPSDPPPVDTSASRSNAFMTSSTVGRDSGSVAAAAVSARAGTAAYARVEGYVGRFTGGWMAGGNGSG